jgi:hypothetical protein
MTLENLDTTDTYLTDDQFLQVKESIKKIHEQMITFKMSMQLLQMKFDTLFMSPKEKKIIELRKQMQQSIIQQD